MKFIGRLPTLWVVLSALVFAACGGGSTGAAVAGQTGETTPGQVSESPATTQPSIGAESETSVAPEAPAVDSTEAAPDAFAGEIATLPEELQGILESTTGEQVDLASFRGQDVVLWFWAPW